MSIRPFANIFLEPRHLSAKTSQGKTVAPNFLGAETPWRQNVSALKFIEAKPSGVKMSRHQNVIVNNSTRKQLAQKCWCTVETKKPKVKPSFIVSW